MDEEKYKTLTKHFMEVVLPTMNGLAIGSCFASEGTFQAQGKFSGYRVLRGPAEIGSYFDGLASSVYTKGPAQLKIVQMTGEANRVAAEWKFAADTSGGPYENLGVTIIEFDEADKITAVRQYLDSERVVNLLNIINSSGLRK